MPLLLHSITEPAPIGEHVVVTGSHGAASVARYLAGRSLRGAIFHDAGIGRNAAGIGILRRLDGWGAAAAAVSHVSCRIGRADSILAAGLVSVCNAAAARAGVVAGMRCAEVVELMESLPAVTLPQAIDAAVAPVAVATLGMMRVVLADSASSLRPEDDGALIVTGSHGGLVGGDPSRALRVRPYLALFNDAGGGPDGAGFERLAVLEAQGVAALTVSALSAEIGSAWSTLTEGYVSRANASALAMGVGIGELALSALARIAAGGS